MKKSIKAIFILAGIFVLFAVFFFLAKSNKTTNIKINSENDIFKYLDMEYIKPEDR